jgi:chorismate--pyruvate lyase
MKPVMTSKEGIHPMPSSRRMGAWLQIDGSLSARIASVSGKLTVRVLRQGPVRLQPAEAQRLHCPAGAGAHGREVILLADGVPVVYARSVLLAVHARGTWKAIRGLGNRALADLLFGQPAAQRSGFEFARFAPGSGISATVHRRWREATGTEWGRREVWARCSVFTRRGAPLLVSERAPCLGGHRRGANPRVSPESCARVIVFRCRAAAVRRKARAPRARQGNH